MALPNVTSLSSGLRVNLGPSQADLKAQVTPEAVQALLAAAKNHPGYQANAQRYEFRLRSLDGQAVLELKERNWASKLKSAFTGNRRSQERQAASQAIADKFEMPTAAQEGRTTGAAAQQFAQKVAGMGLLLEHLENDDISLPERDEKSWLDDLNTVAQRMNGRVDEATGLFANGLNEMNRTTVAGNPGGFTLAMGISNQHAGASPADAFKWAIATAVGQGRDPNHLEIKQAARNLQSIMRSGFQQKWLDQVDQRFRQAYGVGALLYNPQPDGHDPAAPQLPAVPAETSFSFKHSIEPVSDNWQKSDYQNYATVTANLKGTLSAKDLPDHPDAHLVDFSVKLEFKVPWADLCREDFKFNQVTESGQPAVNIQAMSEQFRSRIPEQADHASTSND